MENKRRFSRIDFVAKTEVECNNRLYTGKLLNISLKGALIEVDSEIPMKPGAPCILRTSLGAGNDLLLTFEATVAHCQDNRFGLTFTGLDLNTIIHLRRMMAINLGDDDKIGNEFTNL